jgi:hypothetical protein
MQFETAFLKFLTAARLLIYIFFLGFYPLSTVIFILFNFNEMGYSRERVFIIIIIIILMC